ncbi:expansin-B5-like [Pistacia vera]|uniref:expansin-B5-like n=1 Tax=Pistacia vera TaxID=55513 RepID=UPI001262FDE0|nr:expansin-B5-like [Pistacia vera]
MHAGGSCGYGSAVSQRPFSSFVTAIGANLYNSGKSNMHGKQIVFHAEQRLNPNYFAVVVEFEEGDGDLGAVDLKEGSGSGECRSMTQSWGAVWKLSIKLTSKYAGKTPAAENMIPQGWKAAASYRSVVEFEF